MSTTIEDRVILLLRDEAGDSTPIQSGVIEKLKSAFGSDSERKPLGGHGFWERLSEYTKISSKRWRKVYSREQRITSDMFEALSKLFPDYAFWLATGITDASNGHIAPYTAQIFPERMYIPSSTTNTYFRASLKLMETLYIEGKVNLDDEKERMYASERTRPLAHWWDSALCESAYKIAASDEYAEIKELWKAREKERTQIVEYIMNPAIRPSITNKIRQQNSKLEKTPFLGVDQRIKHQDLYDLFYETQNARTTKFALSVMNTPPSNLSDLEFDEISRMPYSTIRKYIEYHQINEELIFQFKGGTIRMADSGITNDEIERFRNIILNMRKEQSDN